MLCHLGEACGAAGEEDGHGVCGLGLDTGVIWGSRPAEGIQTQGGKSYLLFVHPLRKPGGNSTRCGVRTWEFTVGGKPSSPRTGRHTDLYGIWIRGLAWFFN